MPTKKTLNEILAENLERWRESKGLTQVNAAAILGISQPAYSRLTHCGLSVRLDTLEHYSKVTKLSPAELLTPR